MEPKPKSGRIQIQIHYYTYGMGDETCSRFRLWIRIHPLLNKFESYDKTVVDEPNLFASPHNIVAIRYFQKTVLEIKMYLLVIWIPHNISTPRHFQSLPQWANSLVVRHLPLLISNQGFIPGYSNDGEGLGCEVCGWVFTKKKEDIITINKKNRRQLKHGMLLLIKILWDLNQKKKASFPTVFESTS